MISDQLPVISGQKPVLGDPGAANNGLITYYLMFEVGRSSFIFYFDFSTPNLLGTRTERYQNARTCIPH